MRVHAGHLLLHSDPKPSFIYHLSAVRSLALFTPVEADTCHGRCVKVIPGVLYSSSVCQFLDHEARDVKAHVYLIQMC